LRGALSGYASAVRWLAALIVLGLATPAAAQEAGPQACGQEGDSADYGDVEVGQRVVVQRHRFVGGDPNWDDRMARFIGREARVTRLSGVDERGCPGVRVDVDGGRWFWRVRDLNVGTGRPTRRSAAARRSPQVIQACGFTDETVRYGRMRVGAQVVLGRHRPVDGADNWSAEMTPFLGRTARVVELSGIDTQGCPGVRVDVDGREWFWRVRDLRPADGEAPVVFRPGLASDHGRPEAAPPVATAADPRVPQQCGMTDQTVAWGPVSVGTEVVIGRHRPVDGETNWVPEMEPFVGRRAAVTVLVGVDEQGCGLVHLDLDEGDFFWRLRDLHLATDVPTAEPAAEPAPDPEPPAPRPEGRPPSGRL